MGASIYILFHYFGELSVFWGVVGMDIWETNMIGIRLIGSEDVYKPDEDSLLIASYLSSYKFPYKDLIIDFGSGSGLLSIVLGKRAYYTLAIDIEFEPLLYSYRNAVNNGADMYIDFISTSSYLDVLREDISIFVVTNPPYLPLHPSSVESRSLA
jgi:methylase of polypeptide subunit release factors